MKTKFLKFVDDNNQEINDAFVHGFIFGDHLDDINIKVNIIKNKLVCKCVKDHLSDDDVEHVNAYLEMCNPEDMYEFIDFFKTTEFNAKEQLTIVADKNSDIFNKITSQSNLDILNDISEK